MTRRPCPFEAEIMDQCTACAELDAIRRAFQEDEEQLRASARIPGAGQVWWRAAMRARLDASHAAAAPLTWMQGVTAACAMGLASALLMTAWPSVDEAARWLGQLLARFDPTGGDGLARLLVGVLERSLPFALTAAVCLVLGPLMLFAVLSDD